MGIGKLVLAAVLIVCLAVGGGSAGAASTFGDDALVFFWRVGCPYCEAERDFLVELAAEFPDLTILEYEVGGDAANRDLFIDTLAEFGMEPRGVPTTIYRGRVWEGFTDEIGEQIRNAVAARFAAEDDAARNLPADSAEVVNVPVVGEVTISEESLLVSTVAIALVDGFNPCSLWVLSMLLALVLHTGSRRRVVAVGSVFLAITTLLYGLYMLGAYSALSYMSFAGWIRIAVAMLALGFGLINLKDYFFYGHGVSLAIPEARKPRLYERMRSVAVAEAPLPKVLTATAALAVGVSLIETPCTAGFPLMWANLVGGADVGASVAATLFGVYMAVFLVDELAVFGAAVVAMRVTKLQERHGRVLKLVGGVVMVVLAVVLIAAPHLMESASGAALVFVAAGVICAALLAFDRHREPASRPPKSARRRVGSNPH